MNEITVGLALYDLVPVLLSGLGLFFLAKLVSHTTPQNRTFAFLGVGLVVLAGTLKAFWKLDMALFANDIVLFDQALFPLMAPGFTLITIAVWGGIRHLREKKVPNRLWIVPLVLIVGAIALSVTFAITQPESSAWRMTFLGLASIANVALSVMLIAESIRRRQWGWAGLFFINIAMVFALQPIAQMETHSIAMHWFEQTMTAVGAGAFAAASFFLMRTVLGPVQQEDITISAVPAAGR